MGVAGLEDQHQPERGTPAWWNQRYENGDIPWDTGIVPPELQSLVAQPDIPRGWALDLGCGTGLNSRFLARHGFHVIGVDLALSALRHAVLGAAPGLPAYFCAGDVADLCFIRVIAVLAVDIGCFHSLPLARRSAYVASLAAHVHPGGLFLLYALSPQAPGDPGGPPGLVPREIAMFAPWFSMRWAQHGYDRERPATWYLLQRSNSRLVADADS